MDIVYDDAALRIQYASTADYAGVLDPVGTAPGENGGYDQFDANLRLVVRHWFSPGDQIQYGYRYDPQGRLLTVIGDKTLSATQSHVQYVQDLVYDCP
jgi:hypothetical protein